MTSLSSLSDSHFVLFGLPEQFAIDADSLDHAYRTVQAQVHPDRFAAAGDAQKRVAMQWATRANEAYQTLRDPLKRAKYLLHLRGVDVGAEDNTAMEPAFLMQQMEWREAIEDAVHAKNVDALDALSGELRDDERARLAKLAALIDSGSNQPAAEAVRQLMFIERVAAEIETQIERLEG
ncbi:MULTISPECIES: Fe-S protein assembly co-chaperone HscB [Paraburkholderia]|jgi:molecular chaperone HscB|uniref:Co-chaperone protein HscB homolog n=1 Tax=Paraburkholderia tropica TaxID=92647 RepID=A0A1A5XDU2_9BURK|nr:MULTISPECIES: Fe-S protein assembly co-chaperone HscB [Paraburkholderia]MBB2999697.1 molecular chaperone HscB [Paraburkholderia tropica]MBB6318102.1 molecular chaperone HscB [Paraburkholderia tropica]MBN3811300.1 Fe-S protein assembly co-chaperone HscB [Paraburkholderia sp. Ac-20347]MDE1141436.1 Fe-S protein assembly co-chaperone HscB [Paraburkholderia tropica]OBR51494.1 co-chaperone HscB [Paraburkholderia tropica]